MKSVVHEIGGLPFDPDTGRRVYLFTAWSPEAINCALAKVRKHDRQHVKIQHHFGMDGLHGPEWWSFTACINARWVFLNRFEGMSSRYGLQRWVWTRASETLDPT